MNIRSLERRMQDTIKVKYVTGASGSGSYTYGAEVTIAKCRKENGYFEAINSKGQEIKSKTQIINFERAIPEGTLITEVNGVALAKPLKVVADSAVPAINYDATLYTGMVWYGYI